MERAEPWAELWGDFARPAAERLLAETAVRAGTRLLDIGCGSGELCALGAGRGAADRDRAATGAGRGPAGRRDGATAVA